MLSNQLTVHTPPVHDRFILGTVQLGMPYGIANKTGMPSLDRAKQIITTAKAHGISWFDTAIGYGESETVLGQSLQTFEDVAPPHIISKLPPSLESGAYPEILQLVQSSLARLQVRTLACLMLHREEHLPLLTGVLAQSLSRLQQEGYAQCFGCSVYTPEKAIEALENPMIKAVQLPFSLFDRRFEQAGVFALAQRLNKQIHIRSTLLQGVLCMAPNALPANLQPLAPALAAFHALCKEANIFPAQTALQWVLQRHPQAKIVFGAELPSQVAENCQAAQQTLDASVVQQLDAIIPPQIPQLLNPSFWSTS